MGDGQVIPTLKRGVNSELELEKTFLNIVAVGGKYNSNKHFPYAANKISIPAYPWNRSEYWLDKTSQSMADELLFNEHPLLGWRIKSGEISWENHLDTTNVGYISDHVVGGSVVMPASGFVEMSISGIITVEFTRHI